MCGTILTGSVVMINWHGVCPPAMSISDWLKGTPPWCVCMYPECELFLCEGMPDGSYSGSSGALLHQLSQALLHGQPAKTASLQCLPRPFIRLLRGGRSVAKAFPCSAMPHCLS